MRKRQKAEHRKRKILKLDDEGVRICDGIRSIVVISIVNWGNSIYWSTYI